MKVLLLNGSTRCDGCTFLALQEVERTLRDEGVETELIQMGGRAVQDCIACGKCAASGRCVFDDLVNQLLDKAECADGFVFGSPVYYAHPSGQLLALMDRLFYAGGAVLAHKPAAAVFTARRAGATASLDVLNKYFTIAEMPVVSATYWNMVFGPAPAQVPQDLEGLQTMRNLGRNMAWLLRCIQAGREQGIPLPVTEHGIRTSFNR